MQREEKKILRKKDLEEKPKLKAEDSNMNKREYIYSTNKSTKTIEKI